MRMPRRTFWALLAVIWPVAFLVCWMTGPVSISLEEAWRAIRGSTASEEAVILLNLRLPRLAVAALAGASLSFAGALLQALLRNPLADPFILGVSGGAAAAVVLGAVLGWRLDAYGLPTAPVLAFGGALAAVHFIYAFSRRRGHLSVQTMLLSGIALQALLTALILFAQSLLEPHALVRTFHWLMGRVGAARPGEIGVFLALWLGAVIWLIPSARDLNALCLDETHARAVGVDPERVKRRVFIGASLLTGASVAFTGLIGFVGILVPHLVRLLIGPDHRHLLPATIVVGSLFLVVADTGARTLFAPSELPVGVLTALIGAPFFLALLARRRPYDE